LPKYINKFISVDHCNLFISNRLKMFNIVYTMQNNISFNLVQLKFYTVSKKRLEFYCKCENKFGLYCFLSLYLSQRFTNNLQTKVKIYIMKDSIRLELTEHLNDTIENLDSTDEIHFHAFNEDYYIIGYYQAEEWLKKHDLGVFEAIGICQEFEKENFGELQTSFDNAEKLVNHLVYWYGLELCNELELS